MELELERLTPEQRKQRQIDTFAKTYGSSTLKLACCAAFPHTLTADLLYCLRDNFVPKAPWCAVGDVLLSNLCICGSRDLYSIEIPMREMLLKRHLDDGGEQVIEELQDFMAHYIQHRITLDQNDRAQVLGQNLDWLPLACMKPGKALEKIRADLLALAKKDVEAGLDPRERYRLSALVDSFASLPAMQMYRNILFQWSQLTRQGEPIEEEGLIEELDGVEVKTLFFDKIELAPESEVSSSSGDVLKTLTFQTIKVNDEGEVIDRPECSVKYFDEVLADGVSIRMIAIPSGEFMMGSPDGQGDSDEYPQHFVQVPPFFMSETPVTQKQWKTVVEQYAAISSTDLNPTPSNHKGAERPVESVSWHDVTEFCQAIAAVTHRAGYRLSTEAEWEYACRAGSTKDFAFGNTLTKEMAHFDSSSTAKVKQTRKPNAFGLYDMHGNVWEWCQDTWHDNYKGAPTDGSAWESGNDKNRVLRGGSWIFNPRYCRSALRIRNNPGERLNINGFRLVLSLPRTS